MWRWASIALRIVLALLAAWALRRELVGVDQRALLSALGGYDARRILLGVVATVSSFLLLGVIELLALRYADRLDVPRLKGVLTGFVANALSQSIGVALLTGAAVRVRAYRAFGLGTGDIARITAFVTLTVTLGLLATGAVAFLASAAPLQLWHFRLPVRAVGAVLAITVLSYLAWSALGTRGFAVRGKVVIARPRPAFALMQTAIASMDWIITGSILFLVLPAAAGVAYGTSLRVYLVAQTMGTLSHVPGGAGVFELLVLALLAPVIAPSNRAAVVASLVVFRTLYYVMPLVVACVIAGIAELRASGAREVAHAG